MWPVMMQTILISNVQERKWRRLAGLLGGWWQHQSRMEMSCRAYWLTMKVSSPQKVDLNQPLPDDWCRLISQNHIMPALFDHDFGGNREGVLGACPFEVLHIIIFSLDYWSINRHLCSTIALSHLIFRSGWTSGAHLMYPVLSYQVISQDHVHLLMNMTGLMAGILRVEERGNVHTSQRIDIDSRSKIQKFVDWLKTCPSARDNKIASWDVFSRVSVEKVACIVNGFLECQSNRSIPSLLYWAGLTAVTKMQGQDFSSRVMPSHNTFHGRNDGTTICGAGERLDTSVMAWHFHEW